ncbi:MAG: enoyl-CoA hydratase/isomerase family protein [Novosphingobium sp.]
MNTDEVIVRREGIASFLSLNRPKAIHALTATMDTAMTEALLRWRDDAGVHAVIIDHAEGRGFCAGGDITYLRNSALNDGGVSGRQFFYEEYQLNNLLMSFGKPVVAFMDGITMGGGVGISQPAQFCVATENTRFAMPETGIGLFPDVGGGWHLSRLPGRVGQFLALTGARFDGAECLWAGLATHYLPPSSLPEAKLRIAAGEDIGEVLAGLALAPPEPRVAANADLIARHFASDRFEDILASLAADPGDWAAKELTTLRAKSPLACKVSLRLLVDSLTCPDFAANMVIEYRIGSRMLTLPDFAEGVRALIVDKDNAPQWNPATPEGATDELIASIFAPLPADEEWKPL